jgi:hypothetical protein
MRDYFTELYGGNACGDDDDESKERRILPDGGSVRRPLLLMDSAPPRDAGPRPFNFDGSGVLQAHRPGFRRASRAATTSDVAISSHWEAYGKHRGRCGDDDAHELG